MGSFAGLRRPGRTFTCALLACSSVSGQQPLSAPGAFSVRPVADLRVATLPRGPLFWRVERFPSFAAAKKGAGDLALITKYQGEVWRFTLGPPTKSSLVGRMVATIGPVPFSRAANYLLRVNRAGGPPGAATSVHTHPGSEAFIVLSGSLCQRTQSGMMRLEAGRSMNGHRPGMVMQLESCGTASLDQFVMFVVDAGKPFSSPASFE
jgi:hypothetical protein